MRAPPAAVKHTIGQPRSIAARAAVMKPSPAAMPSDPPMKAKSWTSTTAYSSCMRPKPIDMTSLVPDALRAEVRRSR